MLEVSRFYGIVIRFYYRDHPPMHEALIEIETGNNATHDLLPPSSKQFA